MYGLAKIGTTRILQEHLEPTEVNMDLAPGMLPINVGFGQNESIAAPTA